MSDKSDTPRTDERCAAIMAWQAKESDWPDFARQLERELAEAMAERDKWNKAWKIATGHLVNEEKESEYQLQRAEKAEAECERLRDALQVCLSYWLSDANPDELQGSVAHMKHISGFAAAIDTARKP